MDSYEWILIKYVQHKGDFIFDEITSEDIRSYLAWLRTDYKPVRMNEKTHQLSKKTIRDVWMTFVSLFKWACVEFPISSPISKIKALSYKKNTPVVAFYQSVFNNMLQFSTYTR